MVRKFSRFAQALATPSLLGVGLLTLCGATNAFAQAAPRITSPVENSALVSIPGQVHPWARAQFDRGPAPANLNGRMLLVLKRSPEQESALQALLAEQQDPSSPNFHKWLTPDEFGKRFGVADSDVQTVTGYLSAQGMNVGRVYGNHMAIEVTATPAQIKSTFQTEIHVYSVAGKTFYANNSNPEIPSALSSVVSGFAALNNFRAAGGSGAGTEATFDATTHTLKPLYTVPGTTTYGVSPADLATQYDIPASTGTGKGGQNVNVGIIGDSDINVSYVNNYRTTFGLSANPPIVVVDGNDPGVTNDAYIAYKQIELVGAVAPNATIYYYTSATTDYDTGLDFALVRAVSDNNIQVLLIGFQACETAIGDAGMYLINQSIEQAAAQGMTVVAAAGNTGSAGCEVPGTAGSASTGYAVNGYASSPYETAVGGTDFYYTSKLSNYWGANSTTTTGLSLKAVIPEQVWNDSYPNYSNNSPGTSVELAGGGGISTAGLITNDANGNETAGPQPIPSWQVGKINGISSTARVIPDVSFFAGSGANNTEGYNNAAYLFCMQSSDCSGGSVTNGTVQFTYSGGTEASSAIFVGAVALAVNRLNSSTVSYGLGNVNPYLYSTIGTKTIVHDVTQGNNELACTGTTNCNNGVMTGYTTKTGYDAASGIGSLDITNFVTNYAAVGTKTPTVALTITDQLTGLAPKCGTTPNCTQHSHMLTFKVNVTGSGGTPTGDVSIFTSSPLQADATQGFLTLSGGTGSFNSNLLPGGTYNVYAHYTGDSTFGAGVSTGVPLTVQAEACQMVVYGHNVNIGSSTNINYGSPVTITAEPYSWASTGNVAIPSGSLNVMDTYNGTTSQITTLPLNSEGAATFSSNLLAFGSHSITLVYPGDASFGSCQTGAFQANITKSNTSLTLNPPNPNVSSGSIALTAVVQSSTTPNNGIPPSGTITFKNGTTVLATVGLTAGFDQYGNAIRSASVIISSSIVPTNGSITISASYSGDTNYNPQTSGTTVTNNPGLFNGFIPGPSTTTITGITDSQGIYTTNPNGPFPTTDSLTLNIQVSTPNNSPNQGCILFGLICSNTATLSVYANGVLLSNNVTVNSNGTESYTVPQLNGYMNLPSGQVVFTVLYSGWSYTYGTDFYQVSASSGVSSTLTISDDRTSADFSLQSDTTVNQSAPLVSPTTTATYNLRLTSLYNFNSAYSGTAINLSCGITGYSVGGVRKAIPAGLACSFGNNAPTIGASGYTTTTLTVGPASGYSIASNTTPAQPATRWWMAGGGTTLACIFLLGLPARRRKWQSLLGVCVLAIVGFGMTGCGATVAPGPNQSYYDTVNGGSSGSQANPGPAVAAGTYTVLVTATTTTNTTLTHTLPVQVLVGTTN